MGTRRGHWRVCMSTILAGQTALVTGAGNGLGRAIARALSSRQVEVVLVGRDRQKLESVREEIRGEGGRALVVVCDVTSEQSVAAAAAQLAGHEVSILVNNAGVAGPVAPLVDISLAEWEDVFAVNVTATFLLSRAFLPPMIERRRGAIVNIASVAAKRPLAGRTPYGASKAAVLGLTATLAVEAAPHGVSVNSLSPGPVAGPRMTRNFELEATRRGIPVAQAEQEYVGKAASGRMVTEEEVGEAVVGILAMSGLHGADIDLTAGMIAR